MLFSQVLRESFEDEEEETEGSQAEDTASAAKGELPPETEPASPGSEQRRKAILQKLEGDDTQLEAGLKVGLSSCVVPQCLFLKCESSLDAL